MRMTNEERLHNDRFHDLLTHLTLITGYVQFAQRAAGRMEPDDVLATYLARARDEMTVLTILLDEFQRAISPTDGRDDPSSREL
jgi:hypothetical protein